jgi:hypothetical protein
VRHGLIVAATAFASVALQQPVLEIAGEARGRDRRSAPPKSAVAPGCSRLGLHPENCMLVLLGRFKLWGGL